MWFLSPPNAKSKSFRLFSPLSAYLRPSRIIGDLLYEIFVQLVFSSRSKYTYDLYIVGYTFLNYARAAIAADAAAARRV